MKFKKGDQVRTDDGQVGEILYVDRDGVEAQVALARISIKLRTDSLERVDAAVPAIAAPTARQSAAKSQAAKSK